MTRIPTLSDQLRDLILHSGQTRYALSKATGVGQDVLSRFVRGERGLPWKAWDKLGSHFALRLVPDPDAKPPEPTPENLARPTLAKRKAKRTRRTNVEDKAK